MKFFCSEKYHLEPFNSTHAVVKIVSEDDFLRFIDNGSIRRAEARKRSDGNERKTMSVQSEYIHQLQV